MLSPRADAIAAVNAITSMELMPSLQDSNQRWPKHHSPESDELCLTLRVAQCGSSFVPKETSQTALLHERFISSCLALLPPALLPVLRPPALPLAASRSISFTSAVSCLTILSPSLPPALLAFCELFEACCCSLVRLRVAPVSSWQDSRQQKHRRGAAEGVHGICTLWGL